MEQRRGGSHTKVDEINAQQSASIVEGERKTYQIPAK